MAARKQSVGMALFTSFLVMVLGAVIWGILYYFGIFCSWVAFLSTFGAGLAYRYFYKKQNFGFYVWIILASVALNVLSMLFTLVVSIQIENAYTTAQAFSALKVVLAEAAIKKLFIRDILLGAGFTVLGAAFLLLSYRFNPKENKAEQVEEEKPQPKVVVEDYKTEKPKPQPQPKKDEVQPQPQNKPLTKEEQEVKLVADYYITEVSKIVAMKDSAESMEQLTIFEKKYFAKMNKQMKENVVKYINGQKYTGNKLRAAKIIVLKLK